jgi:hypothetical protein
MLLRVFDNTALAHFIFTDFELRLDERYDPSALSQQRNDRRQDFGRRDERDIDGNEIELLFKLGRRKVSRINPFANFHARIAAQTPVDLIVSNVKGDYFAGAVLQETVGETAGRSPDIEADQTCYLKREFAQRGLEFQAATADEARLGAFPDAHDCCTGKFFGGFINALLTDEDNAGHDQRLRFGARVGQASINEDLINALALHERHPIRSPTVRGHNPAALPDGRASDKNLLPPGTLQNRARTFSDVQFGSAIPAEPNQDPGRIDPEEWGYFACKL